MKIFSNKSKRLHGLDHLRAIAILLVLIFHYGFGTPEWLDPIKRIGWTGVDLFFVLSGYLIGYQLMKEIKNTENIFFKRFYLKRFLRIIPAYLAVLAVYFSMPNLHEGSELPPLWRFLTFTQNFGLDTHHNNSFSHAWSLCIEEQFYLLLPVTLALIFWLKLRKFAPFVIIALVLLGFIFRFYSWNTYVQPFIDLGDRREIALGFVEHIYYPSYNRMDGLLTGLSIAALIIFKPKFNLFLEKYGNLILLFGIILLFAAYKICSNFISFSTAIFGLPLISFAYGVIVLAALSPSCWLYKIKSKSTLTIATLSYVIYLSHKQVFYLTKIAIENIGVEISGGWIFLISMIIAGLGGLILHLAVEKPFLRLRNILLKSSFPK